MSDKIKVPSNPTVTVRDGNNRFTAKLVFNPNLQAALRKNFAMTQQFIDNEVLRLSDPYVPFDTGYLKKSGTLGTVVGSGKIFYIAPYGRKQYYDGRAPGTAKDPLRGRLWFERMKTDHINDIRNGAAKIAAQERHI